jgi:hypothetical protein
MLPLSLTGGDVVVSLPVTNTVSSQGLLACFFACFFARSGLVGKMRPQKICELSINATTYFDRAALERMWLHVVACSFM